MKGPFTRALMALPTTIKLDAITDADYDIELTTGSNAPVTNICNYFYFIDSAGALKAATAGTVVIKGSPDGGATWLTMPNGSWDAADSELETRERPAGVAKLTHIRITLASVAGTGVVGAKGEFIQTAGI